MRRGTVVTVDTTVMAWAYMLSCGAKVLNTEKWEQGTLMACKQHGSVGADGSGGHLPQVVSRSRRRVPVTKAA
jgi:hypothetical protein